MPSGAESLIFRKSLTFLIDNFLIIYEEKYYGLLSIEETIRVLMKNFAGLTEFSKDAADYIKPFAIKNFEIH